MRKRSKAVVGINDIKCFDIGEMNITRDTKEVHQ